jgi:hypothetical protein
MDIGKAENLLLVVGMGRSGTTWVCNLINYDNRYRVVFEPFSPTHVPEAQAFDFLPYLRPDCNDSVLANDARRILTGKVHNYWVDRDTRGLLYRHRIIKDIRCNLMLGWLRRIAHNPPIVLVVRHPLQVAASWAKLGWVKAPDQRLIDLLDTKPMLLQDFPVIRDVWPQIDPADFIDSFVFQWCVCHLAPAHQLQPGEAHVLFYETLLTDANATIRALFQYLKRPFNEERLHALMAMPSSTNFLKRDFGQDRTHLLNSWKDEFSKKEIQRAQAIIAAFGLDHLYDDGGYPTGAQLLIDEPIKRQTASRV